MEVKLVHKGGKKHTIYEPTHVIVHNLPDGVTQIDMAPSGISLVLPRDGEVIYTTNAAGITTGTYRAKGTE